MKKKILVTGVGSAIGDIVATFCQLAGHEVVGTVHSTIRRVYPYRTICCDLRDTIPLSEYFDAIVHVAGVIPGRSGQVRSFDTFDCDRFKQGNVDTTATVIAFAKKLSIPRIIYFSSIAVYGDIRTQATSAG